MNLDDVLEILRFLHISLCTHYLGAENILIQICVYLHFGSCNLPRYSNQHATVKNVMDIKLLKWQKGCICLCSLFAANKLLVSFFILSYFIQQFWVTLGPDPVWLLSRYSVQHLLSDVAAIFPVGASCDPDKDSSYHWSLWLLCWFLWLLPSAIHINNIHNNKKENQRKNN